MKFRKKPVVVEAVQWTGANVDEVLGFIFTQGSAYRVAGSNGIAIETLEGTMRADPGDWIIKGVAGEFYPCKPDIFAATYEPEDAPEPRHALNAALAQAQGEYERGETVDVDSLLGSDPRREAMERVVKAAAEMIDTLDNAIGADDWSTSGLRDALAALEKEAPHE